MKPPAVSAGAGDRTDLFKEGDLVKNTLEAGAIGYLLKDVSADELAQAIRAAHAGRTGVA